MLDDGNAWHREKKFHHCLLRNQIAFEVYSYKLMDLISTEKKKNKIPTSYIKQETLVVTKTGKDTKGPYQDQTASMQ